jgi:hypothetical protein
LTERHWELLDILEKVKIHKHVNTCQFMGRKRIDRRCIARAFVVKAFYDLPTTDMLIELLNTQATVRRMCGFETRRQVPSAATFSRAFAEFSKAGIGDRVLASLVAEHVGDKVVMHESIDSSAIEAREKAAPKPVPAPFERPKCKIGRLKKGEKRIPRELRPLEAQLLKGTKELIAELPTGCGWGTKKNSKGRTESWKGYKLNVSWADGMIPLKAITTSAWVNDSTVAIPLMRSVAEDVIVLYDLMDAAYSAEPIRKASRALEHVPVIDPNPTHNTPPLDPAELERYKQRTTAERGFGRLKDEFGGRHVRVRSQPKVHMHLMFGLITLFVDQIIKPLTC